MNCFAPEAGAIVFPIPVISDLNRSWLWAVIPVIVEAPGVQITHIRAIVLMLAGFLEEPNQF